MSNPTYDFILPDIGEGISEALLITWDVEPGQTVAEGDQIATISTDKVDVELPAPTAGTVTELCWKPGDTVQVGEVFMRIDTGGAPAPAPVKVHRSVAAKPAEPKKATAEAVVSGPVVAAPSTRKLAQDKGIDLAHVPGSGPGGRILRDDVAAHAAGPLNAPGIEPGTVRVEPLNGVRRAMADKMAQSVHTLAHSTMNFEVPAAGFLAMLEKLAPAAERARVRLSPTLLLAKCVASALARHPRFNAVIDEEAKSLSLHSDANLSVAVATERGLIVPVLARANATSLIALARVFADLVARGRDGALKPSESAGGTFTLSSTGGMEKARFVSTRPIINAPQTATLWVSRIRDQPVVVDGALAVQPVMNCSLSFDHRFIDGADAIAFINDLSERIEVPEQALAGD